MTPASTVGVGQVGRLERDDLYLEEHRYQRWPGEPGPGQRASFTPGLLALDHVMQVPE